MCVLLVCIGGRGFLINIINFGSWVGCNKVLCFGMDFNGYLREEGFYS